MAGRCFNLRRLWGPCFGSLLLLFAWSARAGVSGITYHGRILKADGTPEAGQNVQFKIQIRSPGAENCVLFEEMQTRDMRNNAGVFSLTINDGSGTRLDTNGYTLDRVLANRGSMTFSSGVCTSGTVYAPNSADGRTLQIMFRDENMANWESIPAQALNFAPMAIEAKQIGGFVPNNLLRVDDVAASSNTAPLTSTQYTNLIALINGTSQQYVPSSGAGGAMMPSMSGAPSTLAAGSMWFDTSSNQLKYYNGTMVMAVGAGGGGSGTVTGITVGTGLVDGTGATGTVITTSGTIALPNVGAVGSYYKVTTDAQGRVASGAAALVESDIPTLTTAGHVSGSAITSGTIGGTTAISTSGNLQTSGDITGKRIFVQDSGTNYAGFKAPTNVSTTYSLVLPTGLPASNGMVLSSDTLGNLTWSAAGSGSVSSVSGTAPISIGGTASAPVVGISQANTTTDGYLSKTDWNAFNSKLGNTLASGNIWVGNGSNVATAVTPSGDVTVTTAGGFKVTQIQGVAVSATAPTTAGQVLRYNGTSSYVPAQLSTSDISGLTTALGNKIDVSQMPTNCAANQTLTFSSPSGAWTCSSIAITGSAFGSQAANTVLAAPSGAAGNPTFRTLVAADIPALDASKITTGTLAVAQGGTGTANGSITGTGALTFTAGGTNQNVTLTPSGTGATVLGGNVGIGTTTPAVSLDLGARTDAIALPKGPTQPSSPAAGWVRYNTTSNLIEFYNGTVWTSLSTGSGITALTGDVTASGSGSVAATVAKVNGVTYPASPATNTVPVVTAAGTVTYEAVPVAAGGTGRSSLATNSLLYGNGTGNMNALASVNSAFLTSTAGGVPQWSLLTADTFTQYALLAGRSGGQALNGGTAASENLTLDSTANATKGNILLASSGGNVGIGTTSPGDKLSLATTNTGGGLTYVANTTNATAYYPGISIQQFTNGSGGFPGFFVGAQRGQSGAGTALLSGDLLGSLEFQGGIGSNTQNSGAAVRAVASANFSGTSSPADLQFMTTASGSTSYSERMRITSAGNVGIGASSADSTLQVTGANALGVGVARFTTSDYVSGTTGSGLIIGMGANTGNTYSYIRAGSSGFAANNNLALQQLGGNVGIGTTSPGAKLEVASGTANVSGLKFTNFTSSAPTTAGQPVGVDASGNLVTIAVSGSGTVNSGTANQLAFYSATGSAVSGDANVTVSNGALTLGVAGTTLGSLNFSGNTSGVVSINPQAAAGTYNFNLPTVAGTSGQVLTSGGGLAAPMTWTTLAASATTDTTNASNISSGTLNIARLPTVTVPYGGTGLTSVATNSLLYGNGAGNMSVLAPVNSAVLTSTSGGVPQWSTIASDTFTQYALLAGRAGGQALSGGTAASNNLTLDSTTSATKGYVLLAPSGGNVGIGTTTPNARLEVGNGTDDVLIGNSSTVGFSGVAFKKTSLTNSTYSILGDGQSTFINSPSITGGIVFQTNGTNSAIISSAGNVGIGTTAPAATLNVSGAGAQVYDDSFGTGNNPAFIGRFARGTAASPTAAQANDTLNFFGSRGYGATAMGGSSAASVGLYAAENFTDTAQGGYLTLNTQPTGTAGGASERLRVTAGGAIGVGTTNPQALLDVSSGQIYNENYGTGSNPAFIGRFARGTASLPTAAQANDTLNFIGSRGYGATGFTGASAAGIMMIAGENFSDTAQGGYLTFNTQANGTANSLLERMRITPSGSVGIGTTTPASALDVAGSVRVGADATSCSATIQGAIHLNGTALEYCNGTAWTALVTGGGSTGNYSFSGSTLTTSAGSPMTVVPGAAATATSNGNTVTLQGGPGGTTSGAGGTVSINGGTPTSGAGGGVNITAANGAGTNQNGGNVTVTAGAATGTGTAGVIALMGGNVGIGTTSPGSKLEVYGGNINVNSSSSNAIAFQNAGVITTYLGQSFGSGGWSPGSVSGDFVVRGVNNNILFSTDNGTSTQMILKNGGNVGIGTTTPGQRLDVWDDPAGASGHRATVRVMNTNSTGFNSDSSRIVFGGSYVPAGGTTSPAWEIGTDLERNGTNSLYIGSYDKTSTNRSIAYINGDTGNVGIGTTSPSSPLDVQNSSGSSQAHFSNGASDGLYLLGLSSGNTGGWISGSSSYNGTSWIAKSTTASVVGIWNGSFQVWTDSGLTAGSVYTPTSRMVVTSSGNVGIGNAAPLNPLSVSPVQYSTGTASQSTTTVTGVGTSWTAAMVGSQLVFANGVSAGTITAFNSATSLTVSTSQTVASQAYTINYAGLNVTSSGNVGIGTTSPASNLHVVGSNAATSGAINFAFFDIANTASSATSASEYGAVAVTRYQGTANSSGTMTAMQGNPRNESTSTVNAMTAVNAVTQNVTIGTITNATGAIGVAQNASTGTIVNAIGAVGSVQNIAIGTVTSAVGVQANVNNGSTGTIATSYEIYSNTTNSGTITNQYGIYQATAGSKNYFAGNVGIGTTSPGTTLEVAGGIKPGNVTTGASCAGNSEGSFGYDAAAHAPVYCSNSGNWTAIGGGSSGRTSCPAGFTLIGTSGAAEAFCISSSQETTNTWVSATLTCYNKSPKARLCSASEWAMACVAGTSGPNNMTGHWEWVADLYFSSGEVMGNPGCDAFSANAVTGSFGFRCCFH